jgi:hypothetical protein
MSSKNLSFEDYLKIGEDFEQLISSVINLYVQLPRIIREDDLVSVAKHINIVRNKLEARLHTDFSDKSNSQLTLVFYGNKQIITDAQYEGMQVDDDEIVNIHDGECKLTRRPKQIEDYKEMTMQVKQLHDQVVSLHNALAKIFGKQTVISLMGVRNHLEKTKYSIAVYVNERFPQQAFKEIWT